MHLSSYRFCLFHFFVIAIAGFGMGTEFLIFLGGEKLASLPILYFFYHFSLKIIETQPIGGI